MQVYVAGRWWLKKCLIKQIIILYFIFNWCF